MNDFVKIQKALNGKFTKIADTEEFKIIAMVGDAWADNLTIDEINYIKQFYNLDLNVNYEILRDCNKYTNNIVLPINNYKNDFILFYKSV